MAVQQFWMASDDEESDNFFATDHVIGRYTRRPAGTWPKYSATLRVEVHMCVRRKERQSVDRRVAVYCMSKDESFLKLKKIADKKPTLREESNNCVQTKAQERESYLVAFIKQKYLLPFIISSSMDGNSTPPAAKNRPSR